MDGGAWKAAVHGVAEGRTWLSDLTFTFHFHALEKEMATHSIVRVWRIPGTGSLVGCHLWGRTESDTTEWLHFHFSLSCIHWRRKWQPTPVFLSGESQGRGAWWAAVYGVAQSQTQMKWLSNIMVILMSSSDLFRLFLRLCLHCFVVFISEAMWTCVFLYKHF